MLVTSQFGQLMNSFVNRSVYTSILTCMVRKKQDPSRTPAAQAVLESAAWLFYEKGINAVGVDAIAERAGVTKKTLYDQYGSKANLVAEYLTERDHDYYAWLRKEIEKHTGTDRILAVFDALDTWMRKRSPKGCAFVHAHGELLAVPDHPAHAVIRAEKRWILRLFVELAEAQGYAQPDAVATQLVCLLEGATVLRSISDITEAVAQSRTAAAILLDAAATEPTRAANEQA